MYVQCLFQIILYAKNQRFCILDVEHKRNTWSENDFEHDLNLPSAAVKENFSNLPAVLE